MQDNKIIQQGAEAVIYLDENKNVVKERISKSYRIKELDEKIRKLRTRSETKLLEKTGKIILVPKVIQSDEKSKKIIMEFVDGKKLSEHLNNFSLEKQKQVIKQVGNSLAKIHNENLIHGDLTTSNLILVEEDISKIDKNNFVKHFSELKELNFSENEFAVFGSGPLAIRGIRESNDVDIIVKEKLWNKLAKKYKIQNKNCIQIGSLEIYRDWLPWFDDVNKLIDDADIFENVLFVKLKSVLDWKKKFGREKDKKDVLLIEKYLSDGKIYFIDFGLGYHSAKLEDKAVDIHLFKQALEAKHFLNWKILFEEFLKSYSEECEDSEKVLMQLEKVEKRGRYRH